MRIIRRTKVLSVIFSGIIRGATNNLLFIDINFISFKNIEKRGCYLSYMAQLPFKRKPTFFKGKQGVAILLYIYLQNKYNR